MGMALINGLASFLLTPGKRIEARRTIDAVFNPSFLPSLLHRALASLSIAAFFMVAYALYMCKREPEDGYAAWALRYAGFWAVMTTALQFVPGVWYLQKLPQEVWARFLAGPLTPYWFGGILLAAAAVLIIYFSIQDGRATFSKPFARGSSRGGTGIVPAASPA